MSIGLRRGDDNIFDASAWISQSEAARLRGVSREAIYNLVKKNRFTIFKIGDKTLISREDVENYQPRQSGRKPKKKRNEAGSTFSPGERPSSAQQNRGRTQPPVERNKWLTMTEERERNLDDYISQSEAARIRGVAKQSIANLVRRGRLTSVTVAGRTLVLCSEVENFVAQPKLGRPPKKATSLKATKEKKSNK